MLGPADCTATPREMARYADQIADVVSETAGREIVNMGYEFSQVVRFAPTSLRDAASAAGQAQPPSPAAVKLRLSLLVHPLHPPPLVCPQVDPFWQNGKRWSRWRPT